MAPENLRIETPKGIIYIEGPMDASALEKLEMNENLNNFRPSEKQKDAIIGITKLDKGMVYIARKDQEIIGYLTFHPMDDFTRWYKHPKIIEMGCIEMCPTWRNFKIGEKLMQTAFSNKVLDDCIVLTMEYSWHWDLKNSNLTIWQYQEMLTHIFAKVDLHKTTTNDPEIMEHPANVLMARIGKNISPEEVALFESLRFC